MANEYANAEQLRALGEDPEPQVGDMLGDDFTDRSNAMGYGPVCYWLKSDDDVRSISACASDFRLIRRGDREIPEES